MSNLKLLRTSSHDYNVEHALFDQHGKRVRKAIIVDNALPQIEITEWLGLIETEKPTTRERYAYGLIGYLRYYASLGIHYTKINKKKQLKGYVKQLLHTLDENTSTTEPLRSRTTVINILSIIASFCDFLEDEYPEYRSPFRSHRYTDKNGHTKVVHRFKGLGLTKMKYKAKRSYRKWYTEEEKNALASNFLTLRDKCIFLISVDVGCRIDEIINVKIEHYNSEERQLWIDKSKTFQRWVTLSRETCNEIDRYLQTEWQEAETKSGKLLDYLFVNLSRGEIGKQVSYRSLYGILKACAKRAGLDPLKVIFHAGRSTRAQELLETQVLDPEAGITDALIMELMGWSSIESIRPYKKEFNVKIQKAASDKVIERRRKAAKETG